MRKYFDFDGTINGTSYFLRGLAFAVVAWLFWAVTAGTVHATRASEDAAIVVFFISLIPLAWANLSNTNKRLNALMPENKVLGWVLCLIPYASLIMSIYLIFANSKIENHNG